MRQCGRHLWDETPKNAVEKYQRAKGLSVDGIVGDNTYAKLFADCLLKNGSRGELVKAAANKAE